MQDLKQRTVRGGVAKVISQAFSLTLRVGSLMILARLLDPADFGLVAMVTAMTGVLNLFRSFGLSTAAVQREDISSEQISALFWINLLVGVVLACIAVAGAPLVAHFYNEPRLSLVTIVLAAGFIFNAAGVQHSVLLQRQMRFTQLAVIEIVSLVASVVVGVGMALSGYRYWALVAMTVASPLVYSVLVWWVAAWVPGSPRKSVGVLSMVRFGGTVTLNGVIVYLAYNVEKVLLGRVWGADVLGIYGRAYQLINIPTENLNSAVGDVALSALSRIKDDPKRWKKYFLKGYSLVVAITLPITVTCALFASELIQVVLGSKWSEAAPIFRLLAPTILIYAMINPLWWLLVSAGLVGRSLRISLVLAPLVIMSYVVGLPYGPKGVAFAYSLVMALWAIPHIMWCVHGTVISFVEIMSSISRPLIAAVIAGAFAGALTITLGAHLSPIGTLLVGLPAVLVAYVVALLYGMGQREFYVSLFRDLKQQSARSVRRGEGTG